MKNIFENIKSVIFGHAIGDALGVPVEFCTRQELDKDPVTDMRGFGTYPYPAGTWSDDTSMTLATLDSLANGVDYEDIMKKFCQWFEDGKYTPTGEFFDIGNSTRKSLLLYLLKNTSPLECGQKSQWDNGNGSLMRIAPISLYLHYFRLNSILIEEKLSYIYNISSLTHGHIRSQIGCGIYSFVLWELLEEKSKDSVLKGLNKASEYYKNSSEFKTFTRLLEQDISTLNRDEISGSGYVVDCLEAAIWCLLTTDSFKNCVLKAVNLGEDTDTTAAVAGGLAGLLYGYDNIPKEWISTLVNKEYIEILCKKFASKLSCQYSDVDY